MTVLLKQNQNKLEVWKNSFQGKRKVRPNKGDLSQQPANSKAPWAETKTRWDVSKDGVKQIQFSQGIMHRTLPMLLCFQQWQPTPAASSFTGTNWPLPGNQKITTFCLSWVTRACRPPSYHFLCCRCRNDPPSLVSFVTHTWPSRNCMWFFSSTILWTSQVKGFLPLTLLIKGFK